MHFFSSYLYVCLCLWLEPLSAKIIIHFSLSLYLAWWLVWFEGKQTNNNKVNTVWIKIFFFIVVVVDKKKIQCTKWMDEYLLLFFSAFQMIYEFCCFCCLFWLNDDDQEEFESFRVHNRKQSIVFDCIAIYRCTSYGKMSTKQKKNCQFQKPISKHWEKKCKKRPPCRFNYRKQK